MDNISCQKWLNFNLKGHLDLRSISQVQMFYYVKCKKKAILLHQVQITIV